MMKCSKFRKMQEKSQKMCEKMEKFGSSILEYYAKNEGRFAAEFEEGSAPDIETMKRWGEKKLYECREMATCKTNIMPKKMRCMKGFKQLSRRYLISMERAEIKTNDEELPSNDDVADCVEETLDFMQGCQNQV